MALPQNGYQHQASDERVDRLVGERLGQALRNKYRGVFLLTKPKDNHIASFMFLLELHLSDGRTILCDVLFQVFRSQEEPRDVGLASQISWNVDVPAHAVPLVKQALLEFDREKLGPTADITVDDHGIGHVSFDMLVPYRHGISDSQLADAVAFQVDYLTDGIFFLEQRFPDRRWELTND